MKVGHCKEFLELLLRILALHHEQVAIWLGTISDFKTGVLISHKTQIYCLPPLVSEQGPWYHSLSFIVHLDDKKITITSTSPSSLVVLERWQVCLAGKNYKNAK